MWLTRNGLLSFGDGNAAGSLETTPKAARGCGIRRKNFCSQSSKLRHQITWFLLFCFKSILIDHVSENTLLKEKENKMKFLLISLQMDYDSLVLGPVTVHTAPHL